MTLLQKVLNFLATEGPGCQNFVTASLVQLVGCVSKLGWNEMEDHQQIVHEVRVTRPAQDLPLTSLS